MQVKDAVVSNVDDDASVPEPLRTVAVRGADTLGSLEQALPVVKLQDLVQVGSVRRSILGAPKHVQDRILRRSSV